MKLRLVAAFVRMGFDHDTSVGLQHSVVCRLTVEFQGHTIKGSEPKQNRNESPLGAKYGRDRHWAKQPQLEPQCLQSTYDVIWSILPMPVTKVSFKNDFTRRTGNTTPSSCVVLPWLRSSWTLLCKHQLSDLPPRQRCDVEFHFLFRGRGVIGHGFTNILLLAEDCSYSATPPSLGGIYRGRGVG